MNGNKKLKKAAREYAAKHGCAYTVALRIVTEQWLAAQTEPAK